MHHFLFKLPDYFPDYFLQIRVFSDMKSVAASPSNFQASGNIASRNRVLLACAQ